jgi:lipopolysaccharide transport system ATP-binding protein
MIEVKNLSKVFRIPHAKKKTLFHNIIATMTQTYEYEEFYALKDVSFHIANGEFVGIIGRNGSGKSTLLKIMANIYQPTRGSVVINDDLFPMLELGVGFQSDFSVRDNIYIYGSMLGFSRKEITKKLEAILSFAELERFVDAKLEKLSTGMQMRLGFSIAVQSTAPIMLVDEVLAVGDVAFVEKCRSVFREFKRDGTTIVFVSHDTAAIEEYCSRVIVLDQGKIIGEGKPAEMVKMYKEYIQITS